jgi:hypothetical protein
MNDSRSPASSGGGGSGASASPIRSIFPDRDPYAELLRGTRSLPREQAAVREGWLASLPVEGKETILFELEVLLKGLVCFANPRNHPHVESAESAVRPPIVAQDFREPLAFARDGVGRILDRCRQLLAEREPSFVFQRYLETILPEDAQRHRLVQAAREQRSPEASLVELRHAMTHVHEVATGSARLPRVPFRLFYSLLSLAQREVAQSAFFNPLVALEFRPEFDRIHNPQILDLMRRVSGEDARRLVALCFLSLFRMLRYLELLETHAADTESRDNAGSVYLILAVIRSDARALTVHLRQRAGAILAEGYERAIFRVPAREMEARYQALLAEGHRLFEIKSTFGGIAANLRLEVRRAFERDLPPPEMAPSRAQLATAARQVIATMRPALQNAVLVLGRSLGAELDEHGVFDDRQARRALSERLRRDVWMFAQIVRAFAHKARMTPGGDEPWQGASSLQFVREFLSYFQSMGYPLLRAADYPRFDPFLKAIAALQEDDLVDPSRLSRSVEECEHFHEYLNDLFTSIGQRDELHEVPFDRKSAAESLRLYLGT